MKTTAYIKRISGLKTVYDDPQHLEFRMITFFYDGMDYTIFQNICDHELIMSVRINGRFIQSGITVDTDCLISAAMNELNGYNTGIRYKHLKMDRFIRCLFTDFDNAMKDSDIIDGDMSVRYENIPIEYQTPFQRLVENNYFKSTFKGRNYFKDMLGQKIKDKKTSINVMKNDIRRAEEEIDQAVKLLEIMSCE